MPVISYLRGDLGIDHHHHRIKGNSRWLARCRLNRRRRRRRRRQRQRNRRGKKKKRRIEGGKEKNSCSYSTPEVNERTNNTCIVLCVPFVVLSEPFFLLRFCAHSASSVLDQRNRPNTKHQISNSCQPLQPFNKRDETGYESIIDLLRK